MMNNELPDGLLPVDPVPDADVVQSPKSKVQSPEPTKTVAMSGFWFYGESSWPETKVCRTMFEHRKDAMRLGLNHFNN